MPTNCSLFPPAVVAANPYQFCQKLNDMSSRYNNCSTHLPGIYLQSLFFFFSTFPFDFTSFSPAELLEVSTVMFTPCFSAYRIGEKCFMTHARTQYLINKQIWISQSVYLTIRLRYLINLTYVLSLNWIFR